MKYLDILKISCLLNEEEVKTGSFNNIPMGQRPTGPNLGIQRAMQEKGAEVLAARDKMINSGAKPQINTSGGRTTTTYSGYVPPNGSKPTNSTLTPLGPRTNSVNPPIGGNTSQPPAPRPTTTPPNNGGYTPPTSAYNNPMRTQTGQPTAAQSNPILAQRRVSQIMNGSNNQPNPNTQSQQSVTPVSSQSTPTPQPLGGTQLAAPAAQQTQEPSNPTGGVSALQSNQW